MNSEHSSDHPDLSPAGRDRRETMLTDLLTDMRIVHRRRARNRRIASGSALALLLAGTLILALRPTHTTPPSGPGPVANDPDPPRPTAQIVSTQRSAVSDYIVSTRRTLTLVEDCSTAGRAGFIDDACLVEQLASMHMPAGIIRVGDEVRLSRPISTLRNGDASSG